MHNKRRLIIIFLLIAVVLGALYAWKDRYSMNPDGVSYLDVGDAFMRGDWNMAISAYWSPLYPLLLGVALHLLKPTPYWEFPTIHLVNFLVYLFVLVCFQYFMHELLFYRRERIAITPGEVAALIPEWVLFKITSKVS